MLVCRELIDLQVSFLLFNRRYVIFAIIRKRAVDSKNKCTLYKYYLAF